MVRRFFRNNPSGRLGCAFAGSMTLLASLVTTPQSASAQVTLPTAGGRIQFQTSGPARCANIGDWYTTFSAANTTPGQAIVLTAPPLCSPADPPVGNAAPAGRFLIHRFLVNLPADVAAAGTTVTVLDAGSGGPLDEVDGLNGVNIDPTRFSLIAPNGAVIGTQVFTGQGNAVFTVPPGSPPGSYVVTSETGESRINPAAPFNPVLNNDDNNFRIQVSGVTELLIGQFQGTFENIDNVNTPINFFFLAGPETGAIDILNFDMDVAPAGPQITYTDPNNTSTAGTVSTGGNWNSGTLARPAALAAPDSFNVAITNAGRWGISLANYGLAFNNQSILEVNERLRQQPLPLFDIPPTTAGNFSIVDTGQRVNGRCLFTVTNNFFTNDIINFQGDVLAADGATALPNTDGAIGDTRPDTAVLRPGESRQITITGTVSGFSFMERRVRGAETATAINCGTPPTGNQPGLLLVKRITNVVRSGSVLPGVNFGSFVDDPNSNIDNDPGWAQIPLAGIIALPLENPVRSGDEVTYTVYFLSNGTAPVLDTRICDQIPGGTTFIPGSLERRLANNPSTLTGEFFTPLAPLPPDNGCTVQTNPNGSAITDLGTISNVPGTNFGFIRFRVRVN